MLGPSERQKEAEKLRRVQLLHELIRKAYEKCNPAKLPELDTLFVKYKGKERALYIKVCELYKLNPDKRFKELEEARERKKACWTGR